MLGIALYLNQREWTQEYLFDITETDWRESKGTFHAWNFKVVVKIFLGKFPENLKSRKFPKSKPLNQKFWKLWDENEMEKKIPAKNCS